MREAANDPSTQKLQAKLYRQQWQRLLLIPLLPFAVLLVRIPGTTDILQFVLFLAVIAFAPWFCKRLECPRCRDSIMFERGISWPRSLGTSAGIWAHWECPACLWPSVLTDDQHQRLVVEGEYRFRLNDLDRPIPPNPG